MFGRSVSVCVLALFVLVSCSGDDGDDDDVAAGGDEAPVISGSAGARSVCAPLPSSMRLCSGIGYGSMRLPNLLGHTSVREAQQQAAAWTPLLGRQCHRDARRFLCALFAPVCLPELAAPVRPCRSLCEAVRDACLPVMSAFGFPWPEMFNCSRFPHSPELCVPGEREPSPAETREPPAGSVICEACSSDSDGERAIQHDFCQTEFALRLRVGSSSVDGTDVRVSPQGRSRVLRWRAMSPEPALEKSALYLPGAHRCSCPALDGPLTGSFIALGHVSSGRMVIRRLLRWPRDERTLRSFIRGLLRQDC